MRNTDEHDPTDLVDVDDTTLAPAVRDDEWAARTMRIIRAIDRRITRIDTTREAHIAAAKAEAAAFEQSFYAALVHRAEGLRAALEQWAVEVRAADPKGPATIQFPAGSIKTRKADRWTWPAKDSDLVAALKAMHREDLIRRKEEPSKQGIKDEALIKDGVVVLAGEILTGVTVDVGALVAEVHVA